MGRMPAAIIGLTGALVGTSAATGAQAQDARALLDKTLKAYHDLSTYSGQITADVDMVAPNKRKAAMDAQSVTMLYKRPNKLVVKLSSRKNSVNVYSDGAKLFVYREAFQKYSVGPTAPNMNAMLPLLHSRADMEGVMDPLYFLSNTSIPTGLTALKTQGSGTANGHPVTIVTGVWQGGTAPGQQGKNPFLQKGARWTFYIDKANSLLQKIEAQIPITVRQNAKQKNGKVVVISLAAMLAMRESIVDLKPNTPLDDSLFAFTPPKDATEQREAKDLH